jgi:SAM-dependent methyltransferase
VTTATARFFDAMAADYDVLEPWYEHLYATLHRILRTTLAPPPGVPAPRALDAGCGTGLQTALLTELGYGAHGVDLAGELLRVARQRGRGSALVLGDLAALPYPDGCFHAVTCCGSTLSFVEAPARALAELARVLRPGGRFLVECEHRGSLDLGWRLLSSLAGDPLGYGASPAEAWRTLASTRGGDGGEGCWLDYPGYPPLRLFTGRELQDLLDAVGLRPLRAWGIHTVTNLIPSTVLHRPRLRGSLAHLYRGLRAVDGALSAWPPAVRLANSLVVLARKTG